MWNKQSLQPKFHQTTGLVCWLILPDWLFILPEMSVGLVTFGISIGSEMNFHFILTLLLWTSCVFYIPSLWQGDIKHKMSFKYRMKWKIISGSFYHMILWKISIFHEKVCILRKFHAKITLKCLYFTQLHNAPSYDVTGKETQNWCKKCYVACVLLENLWKGESCDKYIIHICTSICHHIYINWYIGDCDCDVKLEIKQI